MQAAIVSCFPAAVDPHHVSHAKMAAAGYFSLFLCQKYCCMNITVIGYISWPVLSPLNRLD